VGGDGGLADADGGDDLAAVLRRYNLPCAAMDLACYLGLAPWILARGMLGLSGMARPANRERIGHLGGSPISAPRLASASVLAR
jgi:hypothetical protein